MARLCVLIVAALALFPNLSSAQEFTLSNTLTTTFDVGGQLTTLTVHSDAVLSSSGDGSINVDLDTVVDLRDLVSKLSSLGNQRWVYEECGQRLSTSNATVDLADATQFSNSLGG